LGEAPKTAQAMKYLKARWPDEFAHKVEVDAKMKHDVADQARKRLEEMFPYGKDEDDEEEAA